MNEPIVTCPKCQTEIKLTESLAAPLIQETRKRYEQLIAQKETEVAKREGAIRTQQSELAREKASIEQQVVRRLASEREKIATEEANKAKLLAAADIGQKTKEIADLQQVLKQRDAKLAEAQKAQADFIRQQRELDDAKREFDLTVEKKVQEFLASVREKAKQEAEDALKLRVAEKEQQISSMQRQIEDLKRKARAGLATASRRGSGARIGSAVTRQVSARCDRTRP